MTNPRFGLIGTGFMGKAHAIALRSVGTVFPEVAAPVMSCLVDLDLGKASSLADAWGFETASDNWREVCDSPDIDVVDICTPNDLHRDMALAAIRAGKHVYCEKPLAMTADEAREIAAAAKDAGVCTSMGFNYVCNPVIQLAREIIASGEIGDIFNFRGSYQEDYLADPDTPMSWRCLRSRGGHGALADLGTHLVHMAEYLLGPIVAVFGSMTTHHERRPDPASGELQDVENEDIAQVLLRFARGCPGTMEISRIATGKKCGLTFEIAGSKGSLSFDQERMNEIGIYDAADNNRQRGFKTVLAGPEHADYAAFCPASGHGLGINDLKVIEVRDLLRSIEHRTALYSDFDNGYRVQLLIDSIARSDSEGCWVDTAAPANNSKERQS